MIAGQRIFSAKVYVYTMLGELFHVFPSALRTAEILDLNPSILSKKLVSVTPKNENGKLIKELSRPLILLNRKNTTKYIFSLKPLDTLELERFIFENKDRPADNIKQPNSKRFYAYHNNGVPYYLSPFDTISLVRKEFRIAPEKLHECAENQLPYDTIVRATAVKGKYP